jgi:hypothetical protein
MAPYVPQRGGAEQGITKGVDYHVTVRVRSESLVMRDDDAAEDQGTIRPEAVGIDTLSDQKDVQGRRPCCWR